MLKTDAYFVILLVLMLVIVIGIGMKGINHEQDYEHEQDNCAVIPNEVEEPCRESFWCFRGILQLRSG